MLFNMLKEAQDGYLLRLLDEKVNLIILNEDMYKEVVEKAKKYDQLNKTL